MNISEYRFQAAESQGTDVDFDNMTAADNFLSGKGYAYGADIYILNNIWGLKGWIGYSLNWVKKRVYGYNFDEEYYPT